MDKYFFTPNIHTITLMARTLERAFQEIDKLKLQVEDAHAEIELIKKAGIIKQKQKRKVNPETMARNKERLRQVQAIAREIRAEDEKITNKDAMQEAWRRFKLL